MAREAQLFESTDGSLFLAFLSIREEGKNIPPAWIERSPSSRKSREKDLGRLLKAKNLDAANFIRDWEIAFRKECFYRGLRILLDLERQGRTKY